MWHLNINRNSSKL